MTRLTGLRAALQGHETQDTKVPSPIWGHKTDAQVGDTVWLRHKNTIRNVLLTAVWNADPINGKVSVTSPIGQTLVGRHQGDNVRI